MDREIFRDRNIGLLLIAAATLPASGVLLAFGGHPTVVDLSIWGRLLLWLVIVAASVAPFCWLLQTSTSGSVDSYWVYKRQLRPIEWLCRAIGLSLFVALVAALLSLAWIHVLIRALPSHSRVVQGKVVGFMRTSPTPFCRFFVDVSLGSGEPMHLCEERGFFSPDIEPSATRLDVSDVVRIQLEETFLGTTAEIDQAF